MRRLRQSRPSILGAWSPSGITGAHVDWADSKGLNEWECKALELSEERSKLSAVW